MHFLRTIQLGVIAAGVVLAVIHSILVGGINLAGAFLRFNSDQVSNQPSSGSGLLIIVAGSLAILCLIEAIRSRIQGLDSTNVEPTATTDNKQGAGPVI